MNRSSTLKARLALLIALVFGFSQIGLAGTYKVFLHTDALGSVVAKTDENGNIISREEVTPYGDSLGNTDQSGTVTVGDTEHRVNIGVKWLASQYSLSTY